MARRLIPLVNATLILAVLTVLGWGFFARGSSPTAAAQTTSPPRSTLPTVPVTRRTIPPPRTTVATVPPTVVTTAPTAPPTTAPPVPAPTAPRPIFRPPRRRIVRPAPTLPPTTPAPTTTTTIVAIGGHLPPPPSTVPFTTKGTSAHVSPVFAAMSGGGFFVALVIMATRFVLTSPRRHRERV